MSTLAETIRFFNSTIIPQVLPKWRPRFRFAFAAYSLRPIESLNANARSVVRNRRTAETKVSRCVRTAYVLRCFPSLLANLARVPSGSHVAVDFSDFHGLQVLMFAQQTKRGRTIPLYFEVLRYPVTAGSQNTFIIQATARFLDCIGVPVHLVMDRGFALPALIRFLIQSVSDQTFTVVLWFLILGFWIAWLTDGIRTAWESMRATHHPHRWLSLLRWFWEAIERERQEVIRRAIWGRRAAARM